jgi:hypothetical protein
MKTQAKEIEHSNKKAIMPLIIKFRMPIAILTTKPIATHHMSLKLFKEYIL